MHIQDKAILVPSINDYWNLVLFLLEADCDLHFDLKKEDSMVSTDWLTQSFAILDLECYITSELIVLLLSSDLIQR